MTFIFHKFSIPIKLHTAFPKKSTISLKKFHHSGLINPPSLLRTYHHRTSSDSYPPIGRKKKLFPDLPYRAAASLTSPSLISGALIWRADNGPRKPQRAAISRADRLEGGEKVP